MKDKLGPNMRTYIKATSKSRASTTILDMVELDKKNKDDCDLDFISECNTRNKDKIPQSKFYFRSFNYRANGSQVNFLPDKNEIPTISLNSNPIQDKITIKPNLTMSKRPQTSQKYSVHQRNSQQQ